MHQPWTMEDRRANLERRIAVLERTLRVGRIITSTLDLHQLLNVIAGAAAELIGADSAVIILRDKETSELYFEAITGGHKDETMSFSVPLEGSIAGWVLSRNEPLIIHDAQNDVRYSHLVDQMTGLQTHALMAVPLKFRGEAIGVIEVIDHSTDEYFGDQDLETLTALAAQAAVAIENARLFDAQTQAFAALEKANRQLQEMDKLKSAFIGVITHELRTPLANLDFSLQLLERYGVEQWPQEQREQLEQLKEGIISAKRVVDNLVTFATFISKQGELYLEQLDFGQIVQKAIAPLRHLAKANGIVLNTPEPDYLPPIYGDKERLSDAVYQLTHNAIKFTQAGGTVVVLSWAMGDTMYFEVRDTGVGVPEDKLSTLWKDFAQMADPLRRGVEGLGLGLTLVQYVVKAHGGQVWARSEEGVGSTFGFQVPLSGPDGN